MTAVLIATTAIADHTQGQGAVNSTQSASDNDFAWGMGFGALAVIGTIVGIVAASASQTQSNSSH